MWTQRTHSSHLRLPHPGITAVPVTFAVSKWRLQRDVMDAAPVHGIPTLGVYTRGVTFKIDGALTNLVVMSSNEGYDTPRLCDYVECLRT